MCPFEKEDTRSGDYEYYAVLPEKVTVEGCVSTTEGHKNQLYYFESWNVVSLVMEECNTAPYPICYVGSFEEDISSILKKAGSSTKIRCELEL